VARGGPLSPAGPRSGRAARLRAAALLAAALAAGCGEPPAEREEFVFAAGERVVELAELHRWVEMNVPTRSYESLDAEIRSRLLDQMIEEAILAEAAGEAGLEVPEEELEMLSASAQAPPGRWRDLFRDQLLAIRFRDRLVGELRVDPEEARAYFEEHRDLYRTPTRYRIRQIFVDVEPMARQVADGLEAGRSFEEVASQLDLTPFRGSPQWVTASELLPIVREVVEALKPGGRSELFSTPAGYHVLELLEVERGRLLEWEEAQESVTKAVLGRRAEERVEEVVAEMAGRRPFLFLPENLDFPYTPPDVEGAGEDGGTEAGPAPAAEARPASR
jgi:hypothetical protein